MSETSEGEVVLLAAWHLPATWRMPLAFLRVRRLEHGAREWPGLRWIHRWVSRRSLLLTSRWADETAARAWLASAGFLEVDEWLRTVARAEAWIEITGREHSEEERCSRKTGC